MNLLVREFGWQRIALSEAPSLAGSLLIAELFYKFHSFTLEAIAFLATWYVLGLLQARVIGRTDSGRGSS